MEVERRVAEAADLGLPRAPIYKAHSETTRKDLEAATVGQANTATVAEAQQKADEERRATLTAVLDDLQWSYQKKDQVRRAAGNSVRNMTTLGAASVVACALPFIAFLFEKYFHRDYFLRLIDHFPNYGLYTAVSFGLLGAFFSRLISLNTDGIRSVEDAENRYSFRWLMVRCSVGMCGAIVMYYLLSSGIVGAAAPDLTKTGYSEQTVQTMIGKGVVLIPSADWARLVLWSFVAGFSEKLVPNALARAEDQFAAKKP
jgi:hypothetical protein